jgi:ribosomal protein L11 methyltransferase
MSTLWRLEARGPMPALKTAQARLDALEGAGALAWSLFEDGSEAAGRMDVLFSAMPDAGAFAQTAGLEGAEGVEIVFGPLPEEDWVALSLEGLPSVEAGRFTVYGAHAADSLEPGRLGIEIEAGPAFGTGHHATTKGCLEAADALEREGFAPARVLDLGTGTGLLAIAAAKLWPECEILATDIDPESVAETGVNAQKNGAASRIRAVEADGFDHPALGGARFELIFANILAGPLVELAPALAAHLAPGGRVILSGLLEEQAPAVEAAYQREGLALISSGAENGWSTLVMG